MTVRVITDNWEHPTVEQVAYADLPLATVIQLATTGDQGAIDYVRAQAAT